MPEAAARRSGAIDWLDDDVALLRAKYAEERRKPLPETVVPLAIETEHGHLRVLRHRPSKGSGLQSAIVYLHGGGWIVGSPETHADISLALTELSGLDLYAVDYRLAPEHPAPAPIDDTLAVVRYLLDGGRSPTGYRSIVLCGDSAGGSVALAAERMAEEDLKKNIAGVCSAYGGYGLTGSASLTRYGDRAAGLDAECLRRYWTLANRETGRSPYSIKALACASPVPVLLLVGTHDPMRDDSIELAACLGKAGRETVLHLVAGEAHGFLHDSTTSAAARRALGLISRWIRGLAR